MAPGLETTLASWAIVSGLGIAALGGVSLLGGRSRPWGALPLGLFAISWGLNIAFGNVPRLIEDVALAREFLLASLVTLFPLAFFLVEFARQQAGPEGRAPFWQGMRGLTALLAVGSALLFVVEPKLFLEEVSTSPIGIVADWGPMWMVLKIAFFASLGLALWALFRGLERAPTARVGHRSSIMAIGLSLYVAYASGQNLSFFVSWIPVFGASSDSVPFVILFGGLTLLVSYLIVQAKRRLNRARGPVDTRLARGVLASLVIPLVWGLGEGYVALTQAPRFDTAGVWRLAGLGVVTYGIVRWRVVDLPNRTRKAAASSLGASGALAGGATAYGVTSLAATTIAWPLAAGALATTLGLAPALSYARNLLGVDDERSGQDGDDLYGKRVEAYRAALEASIARGTLDEDEPFLESLRERFGLGEEADQVLRHLARQAVVMPTGRDVEGAYERLRLLGEGGAGRTWLARDRSRDRLVVLKEPIARWQTDEALMERALEEARAAARVDHPNVVQVHEVVEDEGTPVIVMEYVDGGSLEDLLRDKGVIRWQRAVGITLDALAGLSALHTKGLVHRDVKPANVLLTGEGRAKVADLGIAQQTGGGDTLVDTEGEPAGTPMYMAPEVRAGQAHDETSEVYACGALLHEMLYGSPPGRDQVVTADNEVPQPLKAVVAAATAQDPSSRYATVDAFAEALEEVRGR